MDHRLINYHNFVKLNILENVDKKFLKAPTKYEEELKSLKKDVNLVKLNKEELGPALAKTQESFTTDEIYKYSRPDSVIYFDHLFNLICFF